MWLFYFLWLIRLVQCLSFSLMSLARFMGSATSAEGRPLKFFFHSLFLISLEFKAQQSKCTSASWNWNFFCLNDQTLKKPCLCRSFVLLFAIAICLTKRKNESPTLVLASCRILFLMPVQTGIPIMCSSYNHSWFRWCMYLFQIYINALLTDWKI